MSARVGHAGPDDAAFSWWKVTKSWSANQVHARTQIKHSKAKVCLERGKVLEVQLCEACEYFILSKYINVNMKYLF